MIEKYDNIIRLYESLSKTTDEKKYSRLKKKIRQLLRIAAPRTKMEKNLLAKVGLLVRLHNKIHTEEINLVKLMSLVPADSDVVEIVKDEKKIRKIIYFK